LEGDIAPTTGTGAEIHAGFTGKDGAAKTEFGFDEFGKSPAGRGFVGRDVDGAGREGGEDVAEGEGLRSGRDGEDAGIGGGEAELDEGVGWSEGGRLLLQGAEEMAAVLAEPVAEGVVDEEAPVFAAVAGFVAGSDVETPRLGVGKSGEGGEEALAPSVDGVGVEGGGVGEELAGEDECRRFGGQGDVAGNEAGRVNLMAG
jgi:hypothetical protein